MILRVAGDIRIFGAPTALVSNLIRQLRYPNPEHEKRLQFSPRTANEVPKFLSVVMTHKDESVSVPRGTIDLVKKLAKEWHEPVSLAADGRSVGSPIQLGPWPRDKAFRPYQADGMTAYATRTQGSAILPCGAGKTILGAGCIHLRKVTTLVVTPTLDLVDQWVSDAAECGIRAGKLTATKREWDAPVVVATPQSAMSYLKKSPFGWKHRFGQLICDEGHHGPCDSWSDLIAAVTAKWRLCLTATPERSDGVNIDWFFGERILRKTTKELINLGWLMEPEFHFVNTPFEWSVEGKISLGRRLQLLNDALINDEGRTAIIANLAVRLVKEGESVLLLAGRKDYCAILARAMQARGLYAEILTSHTSKGRRGMAIEAMRTGELSISIATSLANEGLNIKRLSAVILAYPESAQNVKQQQIGRVLRFFPGKRPKVFDIVDRRVPTLVRRYQERMSVYKALELIT